MSDPLILLDDVWPITGHDLLALIRRKGQLQSLLQEFILDQTLAEVNLPVEKQTQLLHNFREEQNLASEEDYLTFLQQRLLDENLLLSLISRPHKIVLYREERWGPRVNSLYLQHKERYDQIRYYRLQAADTDVMQEVYFRLKDKEDTWESLARQMNPTDPGATGLVGPIQVAKIEPALLSKLRQAGEGKLLRPMQLEGQTVVAQLDQIIPTEFNEELRTLLLRDTFDEWLNQEYGRMLNKVNFIA